MYYGLVGQPIDIGKNEDGMSSENKKALRKAIRKYQRTVTLLEANYKVPIVWNSNKYEYYVNGKRIPYGHSDCPLCTLNRLAWCQDCCIRLDTGFTGCIGTPYDDYEDALQNAKTVTKKLINAAKAELKYLQDLDTRMK
jgi:hypothetical protein